MTEKSSTIYTCDACGSSQVGERHCLPHGWRCLEWKGSYVGDERRTAHYCPSCCVSRLTALDVLLGGKGERGKADG